MYGFLTQMEVSTLLAGRPPGSYLFRLSNTVPGQVAVDFVRENHTLDKALIQPSCPGVEYTIADGRRFMHPSLQHLSANHRQLQFRVCDPVLPLLPLNL